TAAGSVTILHTFVGGSTDGAVPMGALLQATDGNFYGTTKFGGAGFGTVFKMTPTGTVTVLSALSNDQVGTAPVAPVLQGTDGNFYGTTTIGSLLKQGTVFRMTPAGGVSTVHAFAGGSHDGAGPVTGVLQAADGALYGTTVAGGSAAAGTVFSVTQTGTFTLLHAFSGGSTDGALPHGGLVQAGAGTFVGTTEAGG